MKRACKRTLLCAAAFTAWRLAGLAVRQELTMRVSASVHVLLGDPVAYRVTVIRDGPGPGIEVSGPGPAVISQCTVVGVRGCGMAFHDEEEDEEEETNETVPALNVVPATCRNGHVSYPARFIRVYESSGYTARTATRTGTCPQCGEVREVAPGRYTAGPDGMVTRSEIPPEGTQPL